MKLTADLAALKFEILQKVGEAATIFKHISSKNTYYGDDEPEID